MARRPSKSPGGEKPDAGGTARGRALRLLARREHGAAELKHKLAARGIEPNQAAEAVGALAQAGWQSDARYVASLIRLRVSQFYGPLRIEAELEAAGVADSLVRQSLAELDIDWNALAADLHARKFGEPPGSAAEWQKQYRYFAGRGFDSSQINAVLRHAPDDAP